MQQRKCFIKTNYIEIVFGPRPNSSVGPHLVGMKEEREREKKSMEAASKNVAKCIFFRREIEMVGVYRDLLASILLDHHEDRGQFVM